MFCLWNNDFNTLPLSLSGVNIAFVEKGKLSLTQFDMHSNLFYRGK